MESELKFLKNQTSLHYLLNTLNNIYALAGKQSEDTAAVVMRLSELLRFMLYESNGHLIRLANEIKVPEDYPELRTIRYNERLAVSFEKQVDEETYTITPFLNRSYISVFRSVAARLTLKLRIQQIRAERKNRLPVAPAT